MSLELMTLALLAPRSADWANGPLTFRFPNFYYITPLFYVSNLQFFPGSLILWYQLATKSWRNFLTYSLSFLSSTLLLAKFKKISYLSVILR